MYGKVVANLGEMRTADQHSTNGFDLFEPSFIVIWTSIMLSPQFTRGERGEIRYSTHKAQLLLRAMLFVLKIHSIFTRT